MRTIDARKSGRMHQWFCYHSGQWQWLSTDRVPIGNNPPDTQWSDIDGTYVTPGIVQQSPAEPPGGGWDNHQMVFGWVYDVVAGCDDPNNGEFKWFVGN